MSYEQYCESLQLWSIDSRNAIPPWECIRKLAIKRGVNEFDCELLSMLVRKCCDRAKGGNEEFYGSFAEKSAGLIEDLLTSRDKLMKDWDWLAELYLLKPVSDERIPSLFDSEDDVDDDPPF